MKLSRAILFIALLISTAVPGSIANTKTMMQGVALTVNAKGLAEGVRPVVVPAQKNNPDEPPFMNGEPEHLRVVFGKDKLPEFSEYYNRQILVYPVEQYRALFKGKEKEAFNANISALKKLIATKSDKGIKELPVLPAAEAAQVFHSQMKFLSFKQGSGVSFVTSYSQDEGAPIKDGDYFYTFQGMTTDGKYYVSAFYPVKATAKAKSTDEKAMISLLQHIDRNQFAPNLNDLDRMIESISIK